MTMANEFVKEWLYECSAKFTLKDSSVEKLAKMGTPPSNCNVVVEPESLRMIHAHVKEVNANENKVPGVDGKDRRQGKVKENSVDQNK
tara:strand:+ start:6418 stop:6681 length:264 start_codon:yes stop_codon:yes gene_type:complete